MLGYICVSTVSAWMTLDDLMSGFVVALIVLVFAGIGAGILFGLTLAARCLLGRSPRGLRTTAISAVSIGAIAAFPVPWDPPSSSTVVPAVQAMVTPVWPRSAWSGERPRAPTFFYTYTVGS
jgi:hypothetical protein